ncbi:hypothetical protein EKE94_01555 [Mesobaculum littorinae]|uniref:Uncharacterized protein n=1 Tax=Mesobaculum littorinae TaxID=2486419 RepID=A0A438AKQ1_9RHOB|nr:hypothetical protein [Mesobaculum littorinae]RVV99403.1 hypothetical protein EKE94_01555 [Mesobaculum littorinae]
MTKSLRIGAALACALTASACDTTDTVNRKVTPVTASSNSNIKVTPMKTSGGNVHVIWGADSAGNQFN